MPKRYRVINLNTGEIYETITAASRAEGVNKSSMARHLAGEVKTIHGKIYAYYTDELQKLDPIELIRARKQALNRAYGITFESGESDGTQ